MICPSCFSRRTLSAFNVCGVCLLRGRRIKFHDARTVAILTHSSPSSSIVPLQDAIEAGEGSYADPLADAPTPADMTAEGYAEMWAEYTGTPVE